MLKIISMVVLCATLVGCATDYSNKPSAEIASSITVTDSEFDSNKIYMAPPINKSHDFLTRYTTRLGATVDKKTGLTFYTISTVFDYSAGGWAFFNAPSLPGAVVLQSAPISRNVISCQTTLCSYTESINSIIPLSELLKSEDVLRVRYTSKQGFVIVEIPNSYIKGYLEGLARLGVKQTEQSTNVSSETAPKKASLPKSSPVATKYSFTAEAASYKQGCSRAVKLESGEPYKEIYSAQCDGGKKIFIVCNGSGCTVQ